MTLQGMDNIGIVVDDLTASIAFFTELGLSLEGETTIEGHWLDQVIGSADRREPKIDGGRRQTPRLKFEPSC